MQGLAGFVMGIPLVQISSSIPIPINTIPIMGTGTYHIISAVSNGYQVKFSKKIYNNENICIKYKKSSEGELLLLLLSPLLLLLPLLPLELHVFSPSTFTLPSIHLSLHSSSLGLAPTHLCPSLLLLLPSYLSSSSLYHRNLQVF